ncbi:sodium-independent anion transporter [Candidatus Marinamargulisbacteria bacterium SCGC AG-343-D04]|nr:sodium-independent anion transporter [Candidatus Marinamargulisbacteria bacterium SCGC AG-343-D04]
MLQLIINKQKNIKNDILSGITVALALVPEAIAFSFVAHVDPRVGLYAAFMMGLITAIFGGRPGMISGATGAVAVIFAPLVIAQSTLHGPDMALSYLFLAVCLMGGFQVLFGLFKWGKFIRLIPHPVMLGFVNGLAIIIFKAQFSQFYVGTGDNAQLMDTIPLAIMIGLIVLTMLICHFLPKLTKAAPATLVAILSVTGISFLIKSFGFEIYTVLDFIQNIDPSKDTLAASLPHFSFPIFSLAAIKTVLPYSLLAASVGIIESLMTLVLVDELTETRGSGNKESMAQGLANVINGFFGGMGGCAMIGQSMINIRAGGRGRLSGITAALCLLFFFLFGALFIETIPLAALIGVMFMVSIATFEWSSFRLFKQIPRSDTLIIFVVSATTVVVDLAIAVFVGVIMSALVFAWQKGCSMTSSTSISKNGHKVYKLNGSLFFGSVTSFKDCFDFKDDPEHVVIDFKHSRVFDHSGMEAIQNISDRYKKYNKKLHLLNLSKDCQTLLKKADHIVEISIIKNLNWKIADNRLSKKIR